MKARTVMGRGEKGPLCDPGSELQLGGSARVSARIINRWDEEKIKRRKPPSAVSSINLKVGTLFCTLSDHPVARFYSLTIYETRTTMEVSIFV